LSINSRPAGNWAVTPLAASSQHHAHLAQLGFRHQHLAGFRMDAVSDLFRVEHVHHVGRGDFFALAEDRLVAALVLPQDHQHQRGQADGQQQQGIQVFQYSGRHGWRRGAAPASDGGLDVCNHVWSFEKEAKIGAA
jgi:hypothetical protein